MHIYDLKQNTKRISYAIFLNLLLVAYVAALELPDFKSLVERNAPAVVNVSTTREQPGNSIELPRLDIPEDHPFYDYFLKKFFGDMLEKSDLFKKRPSFGSGFIISKDGYVITSHHVIAGAEKIVVKMHDYREFAAALIGSDKRSDVALLKIDADGLPTLKLGNSAKLKVGEWVLAIGSPFGFDHSVTAGIISAIGRNLPNENYLPFIQTDTAINPGNSGGPLFNMRGEVIGINSQIYSRTGGFMGLSFAVPAATISNVYRQLRKKGYVSRGWLGVLIQDVTPDLAESFNMERPHGALIAKILPDSPAEKGGIKIGDIVVKFNNKAIDTSSALPPIVGDTPVGERVPVTVIRNGRQKRLDIKVAVLVDDHQSKPPEDVLDREKGALSSLKIKIKELTDAQRETLDDTNQGVFVEKVSPGPAQRAGIKAGDIILMLNNIDITSVAQFARIVDTLPKEQPVAVLIQRRGNSVFLALRLYKDKE